MKKLLLLLLFTPLVSFGQRDIIEVGYIINNDKSVSFNYKKNRPGSYFLILEFNSLNNTRANTFKRVINSPSGSLTKLKPTNPDEGIGFRYSVKYYKGNLNSKIQYDYPYILPFDKGKTNFANELYSLENTYLKKDLPKNWKSYSFEFENSEIIRAIRKGIVVEVINKFKSKSDKVYSYYSEKNSIEIEHKDGSIASYKGFGDNQINVKIGQLVFPQTKLGELAKYDAREKYRLYLSLYSFKTIEGKSLNNIKSSDIEINYITPKFYINGDIKELKNRERFEVDYNEDVLFNEMRRREIKKYKSKKP
jgi:hypothetical protein